MCIGLTRCVATVPQCYCATAFLKPPYPSAALCVQVALVAACKRRRIPVLSSAGAGQKVSALHTAQLRLNVLRGRTARAL